MLKTVASITPKCNNFFILFVNLQSNGKVYVTVFLVFIVMSKKLVTIKFLIFVLSHDTPDKLKISISLTTTNENQT